MKPDKSVEAILATDYINNVLAIRVINTLVPAPVTPVAPAQLAVESILNVNVQVIIVGMVAVVLRLAIRAINILV